MENLFFEWLTNVHVYILSVKPFDTVIDYYILVEKSITVFARAQKMTRKPIWLSSWREHWVAKYGFNRHLFF